MSRFLLCSVLCAAFAGSAGAQEAFDVNEAAAVCAGCHGEDGVPVEADTPIIWGQQFFYLYTELKDYKSGLRANETMQPIVADYDRDQMKALAQYFSEKPWTKIADTKDAAKAAKGQSATEEGQCSACHNTFMGDSRIPRVAGQQEAYLARTMHEFKDKVRLNAPAMGSLMESFDDDTLDAIANYLATL